jgi:hypothetical protein
MILQPVKVCVDGIGGYTEALVQWVCPAPTSHNPSKTARWWQSGKLATRSAGEGAVRQ